MSLEFVRVHSEGNIEKLKELVSENILITKEDNKIYGKYKVNDIEFELLLYDKESKV